MNGVIGVGTDIIEIDRIRKAIKKHQERFVERLFTEKEKQYCLHFADPIPHFAGRFAAKEASFKALGTGLQKEMHWHDLEILADTNGKPEVFFSKHLQEIFPGVAILISISHAKEYAMATAISISTRNL